VTEPGEPVVLRLAGFDSHGTTRARDRDRWIEVEHGIPGETVLAEIVGERRRLGRIVDILDPAPDRVIPPCEYFREWSCGGCQWQQIAYPSQVQRKRESVDGAMAAAGLPLGVTEVHAMEEPWRYRSTASIALGKSAGFRRHGSLAIVPIRDCPISHPLIGRLMAILNDWLEAGTIPNFRGRARVDVRVAELQGGDSLQVLVRPTEESVDAAALAGLADRLGSLDVVGGVSLQTPDGSTVVTHGEALAPSQVAGRPVILAAGSFFQTNLSLLPALITRLHAECESLAGKRIADVYAGVGVLGLFLADEAREVVAIEPDPLAVEAGLATARLWGLTNVRFRQETAEQALPAAGDFDVVLVDPPRSGLSDDVLQYLGTERPPLILYISCLAESLARDLTGLIGAGYDVTHLELFDFYPQTYHVELLAVLRLPALS
jgi:23S rRNA (uracil1939-C5)-methyltransferase